METTQCSKTETLKQLQAIWQRAFKGGKLMVALKAVELRARIIGQFVHQDLPKVVTIKDMTEKQLTEFTKRLEQNDPDIHMDAEDYKEFEEWRYAARAGTRNQESGG